MAAFTYGIIYVSDMDRSVRFYRDVLGLSLRFESPQWSDFETGGTALRLSKVAVPEKRAGLLGLLLRGLGLALSKAFAPEKRGGVDRSCSFCRKSFRVVGPLVEGPRDVFICGECIELCRNILDAERHRRGEPPESAFTSRDPRAGQSRFGFSVDDIEAFHEHLAAQGVRCLRPPTPQEFGGKVAEYADPDAALFSVSQTPDGKA